MQKVALVTGSSKGIGKAIAIRLASDGYFVYVTYCTDEAGGISTIKTIKKAGGNASLQKLDVTNEKSVSQLMALIGKEFDHLDVLVNDAVKEISKTIEEASFDEWKLAIDTKLHGAWLCTKYALPLLKRSENANIIMITSSADERPSPDIVSYAVATAAANCFMKAMASYLARYGIRVNAVMPGATRTAHWGEQEKDDAFWKNIAENNPMKRGTTVEDIADAAMILINDPHRFINGNLFYVNGGSHLK